MLTRFARQLLPVVRVGDGDHGPGPLGTDLPFRLTIPNSVTTYIMSLRAVVTTLPGVRFSTMRLLRTPRRSYVDDRQTNDLPPLDA